MPSGLLDREHRMRTMWQLSWPAIIEQLLATMVSYADTAMVGALGAEATAAVSVNASSIWLINGILAGVGVGYSVQVSNAIGAQDDHRARRVIRQGILASAVCGLLSLVLFQLLAGHIPVWLGAEASVRPAATAYLRCYALCLPFYASSAIFSAILRCMGNTKTPLVFNFSANLINLVFNFLLIYETRTVSLFGAAVTVPGAGLGVAGAAIASAIAWTFAGIMLLYIGIHQGDRYQVRFREGFRPDATIIRKAVELGVPSALERATINLGQLAVTALVASIGTVALAAHQIANTAEGLCYLPAYGISYASVALVGQSVGARDRESARAYGSLTAWTGAGMCAVLAALLYLGAPALASLFNSDAAVVAESARMLRIVCFAEPLFAVSIVLSSNLRGAHDVGYPMIVGLVCMWGVRIVLAPIFVHRFHLGLAGVWTAMSIDLMLRGVLCALRWHRGRWIHISGLDRPLPAEGESES